MKKIYILIGIGIVIILIFIVLYNVISDQNTDQETDTQPEPTSPTTAVDDPAQTFSISATSPDNGSAGVELDTAIVISYERSISEAYITEVALSPPIEVALRTNGTDLIVTPTSDLQPGTPYSYRVYYANDTYSDSYSFTTTGETPEDFYEQVDPAIISESPLEEQRLNEPGAYVLNQTPYETELFRALGELTTEGDIIIVVTLKKDHENAREEFFDWLSSIDLTPEQIEELDIEYETE